MKKKPWLLLSIILFLLILLPLLVWAVKTKRLEIRKRAEEQTNQGFNLRVLYIGFNPTQNGENMAEKFFSRNFNGKSAEEIEDLVANKTINAFKRLSNNTINYEIVKKIHITNFPRYSNGLEYNFEKYANCTSGDPGGVCERQKWLFDHVDWVRENRICEIANENNADEVWIISCPYIMTYESFMIGPSDSFNINGGIYNLPECSKHYAVMNPNYHIPENFLHVYGHRVEATMNYLMADWKIEDKQRFWDNFSAVERYREPYGQEKSYSRTYCGNAHFPPNALKHYDYSNSTYKDSNCVDWKNFPNFTEETENINCDVWNCIDTGWQEYWFANLPRGVGEVELENKKGEKFHFKKNWWYYLLYPENSINFRRAGVSSPTCLSPSCLPPGNSATVSWTSISGATKYALRVDDTTTGSWDGTCPSNTGPGDFCREFTGNSFTFPTTPGHLYNWWVHAINDAGWSDAADCQDFTCGVTPSTPIPTPTPTPEPGKTSLVFKLKFPGVTIGGKETQVKVSLAKDGEERVETVRVVSDANGVFAGEVINLEPGVYDVYLKGWAHLQKKFGSVTLNSGENMIDWTAFPLLAGDANGDNLINIQDFGILVRDYLKTESPADFNLDGVVNIQDFQLMVENYLKEGE